MIKSSYQSFKRSPYKCLKYSSYFDVYDSLFTKFIGKKITFLEVGVLEGGSLFMWRDFFGPEARIIGVDLNPDAKKWEKNGFEIFIGDQSDPIFWLNTLNKIGKIDILLDDGGHTYEQQIITVESSIGSINNGGLVVVEDTHTSYMKEFGAPSFFTFLNYAKNKIDKCNYRSPLFEKKNYEKKIFNISFFESFVIFMIDDSKSTICPTLVSNNENQIIAKDFRYSSTNFIKQIEDKLAAIKKQKFRYKKNILLNLFYKIIIKILNLIFKISVFYKRFIFNLKNIKLFL